MTHPAHPARIAHLGTGLLAACLLLAPVSLALQFATLSYAPGGLNTRPFYNPHTWAWIYTVLMAVGLLRVAPREGRQEAFRARCLPFVVVAAAMAVGWLTAVAALAVTRGSDPLALTPAKIIGGLLHLWSLLVAPVLVGLLARTARRWEVLAVAQIVPWVWIVVVFRSWAWVT